MFKIEKLLSLFSNEKTKEMLVYSYYLSQEKDKNLSDGAFEQLLLLKTMYPNINIILDATKEKSYFSPDENIIYINSLSIDTFFHELTHLLSYNFWGFQIPNEYYLFKRNFLVNQDNTNIIVHFLNLCERKKTEFFQQFDSESGDGYAFKTQNEMYGSCQEPEVTNLI